MLCVVGWMEGCRWCRGGLSDGDGAQSIVLDNTKVLCVLILLFPIYFMYRMGGRLLIVPRILLVVKVLATVLRYVIVMLVFVSGIVL